MPDRALLICDLDETLIDGNSFRLLVIEVAHPRSWRSLGAVVPLRLAGLVALRAVRRLDRVSFKRHTHALVHALPVHRRAWLTDRMSVVLQSRVHNEVRTAVNAARDGGFVTLLATAAFEEQARPLGAICGFDEILATSWPVGSQAWVELRGEAKRDAVVRAATGQGAVRPWILISDHEDDEPLADLCDQVFWVERRTDLRPGTTNEVAFTPALFCDAVGRLGKAGQELGDC